MYADKYLRVCSIVWMKCYRFIFKTEANLIHLHPSIMKCGTTHPLTRNLMYSWNTFNIFPSFYTWFYWFNVFQKSYWWRNATGEFSSYRWWCPEVIIPSYWFNNVLHRQNECQFWHVVVAGWIGGRTWTIRRVATSISSYCCCCSSPCSCREAAYLAHSLELYRWRTWAWCVTSRNGSLS